MYCRICKHLEQNKDGIPVCWYDKLPVEINKPCRIECQIKEEDVGFVMSEVVISQLGTTKIELPDCKKLTVIVGKNELDICNRHNRFTIYSSMSTSLTVKPISSNNIEVEEY